MNQSNMDDNKFKIIHDMVIFQIYFFILGEIIILLCPNKLNNTIGFIIGMIMSIAITISIRYSMTFALKSINKQNIIVKISTCYSISFFIIILIFYYMKNLAFGNMITAIIGLFSLSVSIFLHPLTNKLSKKIMNK